MNIIKVSILAVTLLSGCASIVEDLSGPGITEDLSTVEATAQIATRNCCYCKFSYPARAHVITVNAGPQFVVQKCSPPGSVLYQATGGQLGHTYSSYYRAFYLDAEPGRTYRLSGNCLYLPGDDSDTKGQAVACAPRMTGSVDVKSFDFGATIISGGTTLGKDTCWPSPELTWDRPDRQIVLGLAPGQTLIDASCDEPLLDSGHTVKTASFYFAAESEHVYTLSGEDEDCMRLLDITSEETVIACEPYHAEPIG